VEIFYTQVTDDSSGGHSEMLIITYMYIFFKTNCSNLLYEYYQTKRVKTQS